jgi:geranylgeranyl diphosphate synthase type II
LTETTRKSDNIILNILIIFCHLGPDLDLKSYLKDKQTIINSFLREYVLLKKTDGSCPDTLSKAMSYSLMAGGKRLRAILAIASFEATGRRSRRIIPVAASIELIHTYSLIHDDLPAMDNDDFRRNKPTNHKVFGEAVAILAGDALLTDAFGLISGLSAKPDTLNRVIKELANASGPAGMVGGQTADVLYEDKKIRKKDLLFIHTHKTGALISASVRIGALMAGASPGKFKLLTEYGKNVGLAYQITDDILDVVGSSHELGKTAGADVIRRKNTYPSFFGLDKSRKKAENLIQISLKSIEGFDRKAEPLREIANYILERRN